jgi:hypothetical protein
LIGRAGQSCAEACGAASSTSTPANLQISLCTKPPIL